MQIVPFTSINCYSNSTISCNFTGICLSLTHIRPIHLYYSWIFVISITPVRQLHNNKRKFFWAVHEFLAPQINHLYEHIFIFRWMTCIWFTLIPQNSCNSMIETRSQHRIVKSSWYPFKKHSRRTISNFYINLHLPFTWQINQFSIQR